MMNQGKTRNALTVILLLIMGLQIQADQDDWYTVINVIKSNKSILIDKNKQEVHKWTSKYRAGYTSYLLPGGVLLRSGRDRNPPFHVPGAGPIIQKIDWNDKVLWEYKYQGSNYSAHHDMHFMPNGNVLLLGVTRKTKAEALAAGRDPASFRNFILTDFIVEIQPTGENEGKVVWEWHLWDHLIQEFDDTKDNFGVVKDHPERMDINFYGSPFMNNRDDWTHCNGLDYNEELDQIAFSSHNLNEFYVIDHSTTTEQARGNSGGKYGKGGDFLYRWGNPKSYKRGTNADKKFYVVHDVHWIKKGLQHEGFFMVFNNGDKRPNGSYSSIDIINPPIDANGNYIINNNEAFGPKDLIWSYTASNPEDFYGFHLGSGQRLENGNLFICEGPTGNVFEVDKNGKKIWEYAMDPCELPQAHKYPSTITENILVQAPKAQPMKPRISLQGRNLLISKVRERIQLSLLSFNGRVLLNTIAGENLTQFQYDISLYASGVYILKIVSPRKHFFTHTLFIR